MSFSTPKTRIRFLLPTAVVAAAAVLAAPAPAATTPRVTADVTIIGSSIADYSFAPEILTVPKGSTVHWHWNGNAPHNVTIRSLGKASKTAAKGSFDHRFGKVGTFRYHCSIHGFKGKVIVK